ncbi:MAG TPA: hypothetical protein VFD56_03190, partial [Chitinophagaceae bacterium]|nr:hypothetical protein [Chitinophagaceae bacterium]
KWPFYFRLKPLSFLSFMNFICFTKNTFAVHAVLLMCMGFVWCVISTFSPGAPHPSPNTSKDIFGVYADGLNGPKSVYSNNPEFLQLNHQS